MNRLKAIIESRRFEFLITALIVINAVTLGLETSPAAMDALGPWLVAADRLLLTVFVVELIARALVYRGDFFKDPWRVFDFVIVGIALIPASENLSVLRSLRILRVLRLVSIVPSLKRVVGGLIAALPGMGSIVLLLALVFYVFAVMATQLFGASFPDWFGSITASILTLFQVMTLDSWSTGVLRPIMEVYPYAWLFFVPFVVTTSFAVLNLFIGIIVSAMQDEHDASADLERRDLRSEQETMLEEVRALRAEIQALRQEASAGR